MRRNNMNAEQGMTAIVEKMNQRTTWQGLPGVVYRDAAGRAVHSALPAKRLEGEDLAIVDRDVFNLPLYTHHSMMASLGCPHHCTFCCNYSGTVLQNGVTIRSPDSLCRENPDGEPLTLTGRLPRTGRALIAGHRP